MLNHLILAPSFKRGLSVYLSAALSLTSLFAYSATEHKSSNQEEVSTKIVSNHGRVTRLSEKPSTASKSDKSKVIYPPILREQHLQDLTLQVKPKQLNVKQGHLAQHQGDFIIYDAFSYLEADIDGDGYHQSFSIVFDADYFPYSYSDYADVYASLYLSRNGGPWEHYYSSEIFTLYLDSDQDEYEVSTTLEQGYIAGHYDILIDLYQANNNQLVASYSSDDNNALYALPLESSENDVIYVNEVVVTHGGSSYVLWILCLCAYLHRFFNLNSRDITKCKVQGISASNG